MSFFKKSKEKQTDSRNNGITISTVTKTEQIFSSTSQRRFSSETTHIRRISNAGTSQINTRTSFQNSQPPGSLFYSFRNDAQPFQAVTTERPALSMASTSNYRQPSLSVPRTPLTHSISATSFPRQTSSYGSTRSLPAAGTDPIIPTYDTNGKKRGKLLVINNINFNKNEERLGAKKDGKDIKTLFKNMGFNTDCFHENLKAAEMKKKISQFRQDSSLKNYDMSVVVIMSHGNNFKDGKVIGGGYTEIYGIDDEGIAVDDVLAEFSGDICKYLRGKPKIFIFQCCRGENKEKLAKDALPIGNIKGHADMLIAFSTLPGFGSTRHEEDGSWYIQCICKVFKEHGKNYDIEHLLKIVDDKLGNMHTTLKQTSTYESRGFKRCYLNPK